MALTTTPEGRCGMAYMCGQASVSLFLQGVAVLLMLAAGVGASTYDDSSHDTTVPLDHSAPSMINVHVTGRILLCRSDTKSLPLPDPSRLLLCYYLLSSQGEMSELWWNGNGNLH